MDSVPTGNFAKPRLTSGAFDFMGDFGLVKFSFSQDGGDTRPMKKGVRIGRPLP
jgi:hypothetical protein